MTDMSNIDKLIRSENTALRSVRFDKLIQSEKAALRSVQIVKTIFGPYTPYSQMADAREKTGTRHQNEAF